jgi:AAA+ ATPase superfamily predicted ATPase
VGRSDVLRAVYRVLCDPQHHGVVLYGQRRIGKTSILQHLVASLAEQGPYRPVYFDLQDKAKRPLGEVLVDLARGIADALNLAHPTPSDDPAPHRRPAQPR